tara:strand:+ start:305 stop:679 length:375 start_codon:yes stop_codon:yes gene_type:complete
MSYVSMQMNDLIYHMCRREEWEVALRKGYYAGSSQDLEDGFIHFSTAQQVRDSAAKHRAGQTGLVLLTVDPNAVENSLRWEPSRSGMLFPHFYGILDVSVVLRADPLELSSIGVHVFPGSVPEG